MANLFTVAAGSAVSAQAAAHILAEISGNERARAVVFVPTRRAAVAMRRAFEAVLGDETSLLPRIIPLADVDTALLTLLGADGVALAAAIPPAFPAWQQHYLLAAQVRQFLQQRDGVPAGLEYALALAEDLMALETDCARAGVRLSPQRLRALSQGDFAAHWEQSLQFLQLLAETWPKLEQAFNATTSARHEGMALNALAAAWKHSPPEYTVFAVGSTASQESTAALLSVIASLPRGGVILEGIDPAITPEEWREILSGHPLFHLKQLLDRLNIMPQDIVLLGAARPSIWQQALAPAPAMARWRNAPLANYEHLKLIPCAHAESEARVITLLMREALETPHLRTALITPDTGLMARVAALMERYGVTLDRMEQGTLAQTLHGSLWLALLEALREPERLLPLRSLLHHTLMQPTHDLLEQLEPYWYGVRPRAVGMLPPLPEAVRMHGDYPAVERLVRGAAQLSGAVLAPSHWMAQCRALLAAWMDAVSEPDEAVLEILASIEESDFLGMLALPEFAALLQQRLAAPKRHGGVATHPQLAMLTPEQARLEQFDRVILGSMTETHWPGSIAPNAWLNLAAQASLGLAPPTHQVSLVAHDVLMLGSSAEVFITWPVREGSSPAQRSRFLERLLALLATHGVDESTVLAPQYAMWADQLFAATEFAPSPAPMPRPVAAKRPVKLPVSALDMLFSDPYSVYARYVLRLKPLDAIDEDAQASDFGSLAHAAIHALIDHWNEREEAADADTLAAMADHALRAFSSRPSTALFWRTRLVRALAFVNEEEGRRRIRAGMSVQPEEPVERVLSLSDDRSLLLHGRIDRLERATEGAVIADYKTGTVPTQKEIRDGYATQLLAYALLITDVAALEYWRLPHAKHEGAITRVGMEEVEESGLLERLKDGLRQMLDPTTPFLATPDRIRDYDGISRYDEWAS